MKRALVLLIALTIPAFGNDAELREKLENRVSLKMDENYTFEDLFLFLKEEHGIQTTLDSRGAGSLGITLSSSIVQEPVSYNNIRLRSLLRLILSDHDLDFVVLKGGILLITSEEEAKKRRPRLIGTYPAEALLPDPIEPTPKKPKTVRTTPKRRLFSCR